MRFFYSDPHFFHRRIRELYPESRPFSTTEEMHQAMIRKFNNFVPSSAKLVYHLGDFALIHHTKRNLIEAQKILKQLHGEKHILIVGNHDRFPGEIGFDEVHQNLEITIANNVVLLNHYRIHGCDKIVLHGHDHSGPIVQGNNINLNCELNHLKPFSEPEVLNFIKQSQNLH